MPGTVHLHRVLKAPPERVYRAFTTPEAVAKWLPPHGFICTVHHMDPRVGGTFKCRSPTSPPSSVMHSAGRILSWCPMRFFATAIDSMTPIFPATCSSPFRLNQLPVAPICRSCRKASLTSSPQKCVTSVGRSPWHCWQCWSSQKCHSHADVNALLCA